MPLRPEVTGDLSGNIPVGPGSYTMSSNTASASRCGRKCPEHPLSIFATILFRVGGTTEDLI